jgi:hypothetical protein
VAITTFEQIYAGVVQQLNFSTTAASASTAATPVLNWIRTGAFGTGTVGSSLSGSLRDSTSSGAVPYVSPATGQDTYLSRFNHGSNSVTTGKSVYIIDLLWITSAVAQNLTTQTISSVTLPSRDADGTTAGRGVYIAMLHTTAYTSGAPYTATITYTNSANSNSRVGAVSENGGTINRWVPFGVASGDEGVRSVQNFAFSALPGTGGVTVLLAYRPIAVISSNYGGGEARISETAFTLGLPQLYDGTCLTTVNAAGSDEVSMTYTFSQG